MLQPPTSKPAHLPVTTVPAQGEDTVPLQDMIDSLNDDWWVHSVVPPQNGRPREVNRPQMPADQLRIAPGPPSTTCPVHSADHVLIQRPRDCQEESQPTAKKRRCQWTGELHAAFEEAVRRAGPRPTPTSVHAALNVSHLNLDFELTVGMVKSHLQKYKLDCLCAGSAGTAALIPAPAPAAEPPKLRAAERGSSFSRADSERDGRCSSDKRSRGEPILITLLDAQAAMGVLVRTIGGYALTLEFESDTNTLVLKVTPPAMCPDHLADFGITTLPLLADAKVSAAGIDELNYEFTRRCALSCTPASSSPSDWTQQMVSTGAGDKTVLILIPKLDGHCVPPGRPAGTPLVL